MDLAGGRHRRLARDRLPYVHELIILEAIENYCLLFETLVTERAPAVGALSDLATDCC